MRIYRRHSALTYFPDAKKQSISPNLTYSYSLNRECIDLKYVPTFLNYPITLDYYVGVKTVYLPESNKTYYLGDIVKSVHLPVESRENDCIVLVNDSGWSLNIFSTCTSLYIGVESFTYLELKYCGSSWKIVKKGTNTYQAVTNRILHLAPAKSTSLIDVEYKPYIFGYGYFNFADIYELYSIGLPYLLEEVERYQNNTIIFSGASSVLGPVISYDFNTVSSTEFPLFQVWSILVNNLLVSNRIPDQLKLKFSPYLVQAMPSVSGMLRDINLKFENTVTMTIDPIYTLNPTDTLVEVANLSTNEKMLPGVDYTQSNNTILPTLRGGIFHDNDLLVKFWGDNFIS